jgi:hypothetical protein
MKQLLWPLDFVEPISSLVGQCTQYGPREPTMAGIKAPLSQSLYRLKQWDFQLTSLRRLHPTATYAPFAMMYSKTLSRSKSADISFVTNAPSLA